MFINLFNFAKQNSNKIFVGQVTNANLPLSLRSKYQKVTKTFLGRRELLLFRKLISVELRIHKITNGTNGMRIDALE